MTLEELFKLKRDRGRVVLRQKPLLSSLGHSFYKSRFVREDFSAYLSMGDKIEGVYPPVEPSAFPEVGDEYGGGIVAMADPISGELVIVPDAEKLALIGGAAQNDSIDFAAAYTDGVNSDYRLTTRNELIAIFGNNNLLTLLDLDSSQDYWSIESAGAAEGNAWFWNGNNEVITEDDTAYNKDFIPVRKVNFYGLPLIDSEFGGGLVYDVVAATREVKVIPKWSDVIYNSTYDWDTAIHNYPSGIGEVYFMALPTRAEALKIFNNTYLCALAGIGLGAGYAYWTNEEYDIDNAYEYSENQAIEASNKLLSELYAIPVRSEIVPES